MSTDFQAWLYILALSLLGAWQVRELHRLNDHIHKLEARTKGMDRDIFAEE